MGGQGAVAGQRIELVAVEVEGLALRVALLVALRGPDSRNRKLKNAATAIIRSAAFPSRPCEERSVFGRDSEKFVKRRQILFRKRKDQNHFREHVADAFAALGLSLYEQNGGVWKS